MSSLEKKGFIHYSCRGVRSWANIILTEFYHCCISGLESEVEKKFYILDGLVMNQHNLITNLHTTTQELHITVNHVEIIFRDKKIKVPPRWVRVKFTYCIMNAPIQNILLFSALKASHNFTTNMKMNTAYVASIRK